MRNRVVTLYRENPAAFTAGILALLAIVWALWMNVAFTAGPLAYDFPHRFHHQIDSPILALELARDSGDVAAVLQTEDQTNADPIKVASAQKALRWNTAFDCVFIPLYTGYLLFFGLAYKSRSRGLFVILILSIALFDYIENACLFVTLWGGKPNEYWPSVMKWALLASALSMLARVLVSANPGPYSTPTRRLIALLFAAAGVFILLGVSVGPYAWLAFGTQLFAGTLVINAIGLFGPALAIPGKQQVFVKDFCEKRKLSRGVGPAIREIPLGDDGSPAHDRTIL